MSYAQKQVLIWIGIWLLGLNAFGLTMIFLFWFGNAVGLA